MILSHNLVTEIQKKLTCNKVGTICSYWRYRVKNTYLAMYSGGDAGASPCVRPNPIGISQLASDTICCGESLWIELALQSPSVMNQVPRPASETQCDCLAEVSPNPASFDYILVMTSLAVFVIVWRRYQDPA